jgi:G patch domain-containing protein 1
LTKFRLPAGFGLGALNDAEDDDIDVYDGGLSRESRRMAYDAGETEDGDSITLGGKKAVEAHNATGKNVSSNQHDGCCPF